MPDGYTLVTGNALTDASGRTVADATISFQPVDAATGKALSFHPLVGQAMFQPVKATVTDGVFSIQLADTATTMPKNIAYAVTVVDNQSGNVLLGPGYLIQPTGPAWDFDQFSPQTLRKTG
jgi:hypothetical protein